MPRRQVKGATCGLGWKNFIAVIVLGLLVYVLGPLVFWKLRTKGSGFIIFRPNYCPPCHCDCIGDLAAFTIPLSDLGNISLADCLKQEFSTPSEKEKKEIEQLTEELKLQQTVSEDNQKRSQLAFLEAKKISSMYQKEAEKCATGMETSEKTREKAEAALASGRRKTALWEARARAMGWKDNKEGPFRISINDDLLESERRLDDRLDFPKDLASTSVGRRIRSWKPRRR